MWRVGAPTPIVLMYRLGWQSHPPSFFCDVDTFGPGLLSCATRCVWMVAHNFDRALTLLLDKVEKMKLAAAAKPRSRPPIRPGTDTTISTNPS
jgi:hypothetical protein